MTSLSQYIKQQNCDRYLRFRLRRDEEKALTDKWGVTIQPLTPLLKEEGLDFESKVVAHIAADGGRVVDLDGQDESLTMLWMQTVQSQTLLVQPSIGGHIGGVRFSGRADLVLLWRGDDEALCGVIADVKASRVERMEHRLQVAAYAYLLRQMAHGKGMKFHSLDGMILHVQEDGSLPDFNSTEPFDIDTYITVLHHLAIDPGNTLERVTNARFEDLFYHLGYHCDGCMYNALCMYDSAERQDLSLVPYLTDTEKRVLLQHGVRTVAELAELMDLPPRDGGYDLIPAPAHLAKLSELANAWPVGAKLPLLVQRAKRALKRFDPSTPAWTFLSGGGFGSLPADDEHQGLIKVFFDAQFDYLLGRIYLLSALVRGPRGDLSVVECTEGPPTLEAEGDLLVNWVSRLLRAVAEVADGDSAPLHLYCYNPYDQRTLLDALKRHLMKVALLPGFFDLMTQNPALNQPIISFLSSELEERQNLGYVCSPLHDAARGLGFDWTYEGIEYYALFRARLFDNRRDVVRSFDGTLQPAPTSVPRGDPRRITIESASRFNSQIPLEYAYAAWNCLPDSGDAEERRLLAPFRQTTRPLLMEFAAHRTRALAHIEGWFKRKARFLNKPKIDLRALREGGAPSIALQQSLREFLYMEHYASLQAKMLVYGLPIERRVQSGQALLLRYEGYEADLDLHLFTIAFDLLGLDPELTVNGLRLKEGDWLVMNPAAESGAPLSASTLKHGRLVTLAKLSPEIVGLHLLDANFFRNQFRYSHNATLQPEEGELYVIDQMADDLNADKQLEALGHTDSNTLYHWLLTRPNRRTLPPSTAEQAQAFLQVVHTLQPKAKLTKRQRSVVAGWLDEPLLLVQGPPGTGKSATLGWAILNRIQLAAAAGRPCRVAISCKTHNAIRIVLKSVVEKLDQLMRFPLPSLGAQGMPHVPLYKIVSSEGDDLPRHVTPIDPHAWNPKKLEELLHQPYLVVGSTPGGLYTLAKRRESGDKKVDWLMKSFDLLVIDEASQMSVPEGVLAASFLGEPGAMLVVGDHRQMPPIIAHTWKTEELRSAAENRPFVSLFEFLRDRGFACESLDESFRLHRVIADFLQENVYVHDGIRFFSQQDKLLHQPPPSGDFVDAVMDPNYPIVVIEHGEQGSQQHNETELEIIRPLIECALAMRLDGVDGVGIVVPHRAQKALLRTHFPQLAEVQSIDTVERFQGGERDVIIVSATASDPGYVLAEADFLLNLNRLNVALSRPRKKLIVVASQSVTRLLVSDLDVFDNAVIWKRLYFQYANRVIWQGTLAGVQVVVRGASADDATGT
ncbi:MAG: AAA domain-containing protein [Caldilineaceae bacterium]